MEKLLTEICTPKQWKTIATSKLLDEGYTVYGANGIIGYYDEYTHENPTLMITCRGATCGTLNISKPFSYINGNAMALDSLDDDIDIKYLYYYLTNRGLKDTISGSAQPQITRTGLANVKINYPNIEIQKKIVEVLDKAQELIDKRKEQIEVLNELVKSRFIEMFGDLDKNIYGFDKLKIKDICSRITDGTHKTPKYTNEGIKFISAKDIKTGKIDLSNTKYISLEEYNEIQRRCQLEIGDILLSKSGSIGTPVVLDTDEPLGIFESLAVLKIEKNIINNIYLCEFLKSYSAQRRIVFGTKGISIKHLHLNVLKELDVLIPPMELQNQFADFVKQVDKLKSQMENSLKELEDNFNSLMQKAFKGELF